MARQIITHILCDVCLTEDVQHPGEETPVVAVGAAKPRVVALCEKHMGIFAAFAELLREYGQPESAPASRQAGPVDPIRCPACGNLMKNAKSLRAHCRSQHGKSLKELEAGAPVDDLQEATCAECGRVYKQPENPRPGQALAVHLARKHGIRSPRRSKSAV